MLAHTSQPTARPYSWRNFGSQGIAAACIVRLLVVCALADGPVARKPSAFLAYSLLYLPYQGVLSFVHVRTGLPTRSIPRTCSVSLPIPVPYRCAVAHVCAQAVTRHECNISSGGAHVWA